MLELLPIPASSVNDMWPQIAGQVEALAEVSHGRLRAADIMLAVLKRDMQLWAAHGDDRFSVMLTEILDHPQQREVHIISATGQNADQWVPLWPKFEEWARAQGCVRLTATCRPGWEKLLSPLGFEKSAIVLEKRL